MYTFWKIVVNANFNSYDDFMSHTYTIILIDITTRQSELSCYIVHLTYTNSSAFPYLNVEVASTSYHSSAMSESSTFYLTLSITRALW